MLPVWHGTGTIPRGCLLENGRDLSMLADDEVLLNALGEEVGRILQVVERRALAGIDHNDTSDRRARSSAFADQLRCPTCTDLCFVSDADRDLL